MKKSELEQLLLTDAGRQRLALRAAGINERYGSQADTMGEPSRRVTRAPGLDGQIRPSHEERLANNRDVRVRAGWVQNVAAFLGQEAGDAREELAAAINRMRRGESPAAPLVVEDAINRSLARWPCDAADEKLITDAIASLETDEPSHRAKEGRR